jgi:DNA-binding HxlR family transcriptional regulator
MQLVSGEEATMQKVSKARCRKESGNEVCLCPVEGVLSVVSKKWAPQVITVVGNGDRIRFNEIMKKLDGISPKTLTDRLKGLERSGLVRREVFAEVPPRVEYSLTEDGRGVMDAMMPLLEWASSRESSEEQRNG